MHFMTLCGIAGGYNDFRVAYTSIV